MRFGFNVWASGFRGHSPLLQNIIVPTLGRENDYIQGLLRTTRRFQA